MEKKAKALRLLSKIKGEFASEVIQYRNDHGIPEEYISAGYLDVLLNDQSGLYNELTYQINLSFDDIKILLELLEEYSRIKEDRDHLKNFQIEFFTRRKKALGVLKKPGKYISDRYRLALKTLGFVGDKRRPKFDGSLIRFEYFQLIEGYYCPKTETQVLPVSKEEAIYFLTKKHGFTSPPACYQYLKSTLKIKGLPSTYHSDGIFK